MFRAKLYQGLTFQNNSVWFLHLWHFYVSRKNKSNTKQCNNDKIKERIKLSNGIKDIFDEYIKEWWNFFSNLIRNVSQDKEEFTWEKEEWSVVWSGDRSDNSDLGGDFRKKKDQIGKATWSIQETSETAHKLMKIPCI